MMILSFGRRLLGILVAIGVVGGALSVAYPESTQNLTAYIVPRLRNPTPWRVYDEGEVQQGVTVPPGTHTVFHLPFTFDRISLDVLFGQRSEEVRFWGYCLPPNYEPSVRDRRRGYPGQIFLSRLERRVRKDLQSKPAASFSLFRLPSKRDLAEGNRTRGLIEHEVNEFEAGLLCYVMSQEPLPLGLDDDGDTLNSRLERDLGTNPSQPDSDADGLNDGLEYRTGTSPVDRDTDHDGLIDGIEDKNWNGKVDFANRETDPRVADSDRDELCDGSCYVKLANGQKLYLGEDVNLNGIVDPKETDPLEWDTDKDGNGDFAEWVNCQINGLDEFCID